MVRCPNPTSGCPRLRRHRSLRPTAQGLLRGFGPDNCSSVFPFNNVNDICSCISSFDHFRLRLRVLQYPFSNKTPKTFPEWILGMYMSRRSPSSIIFSMMCGIHMSVYLCRYVFRAFFNCVQILISPLSTPIYFSIFPQNASWGWYMYLQPPSQAICLL